MARSTLSRSLHDLGLAAWFGGTLANAVALNPAAAAAPTASGSGAVANTGWDRWTPVNAVAIGVHLLGSVAQVGSNSGRIAAQSGVASMAAGKTALTAAALAATGYSRVLGRKVSAQTDVPAQDGTTPTATTPDSVAAAQRQLDVLQWVIPALTGALVVVSAFAGEQERATEVKKGVLERLLGR
ncbi:hypothetical protein [Cellulomonas marina]|uniref:ABC-type Mn/Zn transport systems, ATPase component n=1 Tax=Cellulomonas marina TaxID=988821 RepID=A0A1I0XYW5_9CELL|nr:hypothetical protein [Cellulomonas marina]GIG28441.1 hypothetical protein Cma02nite_10410 [Cellulomonas marina]SFB06251.1 hypothetical protein SAMN05421867_10677 [Cellulomonas marina]